jgi:Rrf2 family nitric oxide-sensitive transcriptional repressor
MRLTYFTDYSLRLLLYLKGQSGRLSTIEEVAEYHKISKQHLVKVVHFLAKNGYVETVRGKNGGLKLGMEPSEINVGAVIRIVESDFKVAECFDPKNNTCRLSGGCKLKHALNRAIGSFFKELDTLTLKDI